MRGTTNFKHRSGKYPLCDSSCDIRQAEVASGVSVHQPFMVESEQVQDCGMPVVDVHFAFNGLVTVFVDGAVAEATEVRTCKSSARCLLFGRNFSAVYRQSCRHLRFGESNCSTKKASNLLRLLALRKWAEGESNSRHQDFQSCALPTELSALLFYWQLLVRCQVLVSPEVKFRLHGSSK